MFLNLILWYFSGLRLIVGPTTDAQEASGLSHNRQSIDIYSNSWGPSDDGATVGGPRTMTSQALMEGSTEVKYLCCGWTDE